MICKRCNHEIPNEAKICGYCGAQIVPEGVIYNGLGEDAYMPPTQKELSEMRQQDSPVPPQSAEHQQSPQMAPPPAGYQGTPQMPPPAGYQGTPQMPSSAGYRGAPQMMPPPAGYQGTPQMPPPAGYQGTPQMPPPAGCQGAPQMPPPQANYQETPQMTSPSANYQQTPQMNYQQEFKQASPPEPSNSLLSPEYHPGGDASPQFVNGFGYSQMPYNDVPVSGDGGAGGMAIASLVLGIICLVTCCCSPWLTLIAAFIGLILGIVGVIRSEENKGVAIGGIVCSTVGLIFGILMLLVGISSYI